MEIKTKFSIGDKVFCATTGVESRQRDCPDCLGQKKWTVTSPAGSTYEFSCPRCSAKYSNRRDDLTYRVTTPRVSELTIGSVRFNSNESVHFGTEGWTQAPRTSYMCVETGVGSGSVYDEERLFATHDEAMAAAQVLADEANVHTEWIVTRFNDALHVSDYQLSVVGFEDEKLRHQKLKDKAWSLGYEVERAVEYMNEANPDGYDVKYAVEHLRKGLAAFTDSAVGGVEPDGTKSEDV